ncbi:MAG: hypothetical protein AN484_28625, partial [Aphanizomenon flos-aquae WA102]
MPVQVHLWRPAHPGRHIAAEAESRAGAIHQDCSAVQDCSRARSQSRPEAQVVTDQEVTPEVGPKEKAEVMEAKPESGKEKTERESVDQRLLRKALVKTLEDEITCIEEKKKKRATALIA